MMYCIIHKHMVEYESTNQLNSDKAKAIATKALSEIERIIKEEKDVVIIDGHFSTVEEHFQSGEIAILCGAYREACLDGAEEVLLKKGVSVAYHIDAAISRKIWDIK